MSLPITLMAVGAAALLISLLLNARQTKTDDIEQISISLHQETSQLKKRIKALEEELMMESVPSSRPSTVPAQEKPVHSIIVSQITVLHNQGFSVEEIAQRSSLSPSQVAGVLQSKGVRV